MFKSRQECDKMVTLRQFCGNFTALRVSELFLVEK